MRHLSNSLAREGHGQRKIRGTRRSKSACQSRRDCRLVEHVARRSRANRGGNCPAHAPPPRSARYSETQAIADYRRAASGRAVRSMARSARPSPPRRHSAAGKRPRCSRSPPTCRTSAWPSHQHTEPRLRRAGPNRDPGQTRRASGRACRRRPRAERGRRQLPLRAYLIVDGGMTIGGFEPCKMEDAAHGATNGSYVGEAG